MTFEVTTIKVSKDLRDRLMTDARAQGLTLAQFIEQVLVERQRAQLFEDMRVAFSRTSHEDWAQYLAELRDWDATLRDGLGS